MSIYQLGEDAPDVAADAFVADNAAVIGKVTLRPGSSVWFGVTIRGDNERIVLGENSNIQEGSVLHTDIGSPLTIGANVTVGHQAMLHGCTIADGALIGMQAVVLNGARIGRNCLVGACALVTENKEFPDNTLILGSPAKAVRTLTEEEIAAMHRGTSHYVARAQLFKNGLKRIA
jgi:carbonic anhydrase/acetyltransferase-like protein (isoleucine patch superfamily)